MTNTQENPTIIAVDDERDILDTIRQTLEKDGFKVITTTNPYSALSIIDEHQTCIVITDLKMSPINGLELISRIQEKRVQAEFILITAYSSYESAVTALKYGVHDYLEKPFSPNELRLVVRNSCDKLRLNYENHMLKQQINKANFTSKLIGISDEFQSVVNFINQVSHTDSTVLLTGESGTGKELVAKEIHMRSKRSEQSFIARNCAAIPVHLIESELFGHEAGAFTDAKKLKRGSFELANKGTIFLDEISEMSVDMQAKLLRVMELREFTRIGGEETIHSDFRIVAATNKSLKKLISKGKFREDLYYRLNILEFHLPPLRDRIEDIPLLAEYFLQTFSEEQNKPVFTLSPEAISRLQKLPWKGNIRELRNAMERITILNQDPMINLKDLDFLNLNPDDHEALFDDVVNLKDFESKYIQFVLNKYKGNRTKTAKALGIGTTTLWRKLSNEEESIDSSQ